MAAICGPTHVQSQITKLFRRSMADLQKEHEGTKSDDRNVKSPGRRPLEGRVIRGTKSTLFVGVHYLEIIFYNTCMCSARDPHIRKTELAHPLTLYQERL